MEACRRRRSRPGSSAVGFCGFYGAHFRRFAPSAEMRCVRMRDTTYGWNLEMLMRVAAAGLPAAEIPVGQRRRIGGGSKDIGESPEAESATVRSPDAKGETTMHWVISGTSGPTDPTRAMLPFLFAASALQAGDRVTLMLFHDAMLMAVEGIGKTLVPVGPPNRYEEIAGN